MRIWVCIDKWTEALREKREECKPGSYHGIPGNSRRGGGGAHICTHTHAHVSTYSHKAHTHVCMCIHIHIHAHMCMCTPTSICSDTPHYK